MADFWTLPTRKALLSNLKAALDAATPAVEIIYPDVGGDPKSVARYVRPTNHVAPVKVATMGKNGRLEGRGFLKCGIFTRTADSQDANDRLAGIVAQAFPYDMDLVRDLITVNIGTVDHGDFINRNGWGYSPVDVNWTVWRIR